MTKPLPAQAAYDRWLSHLRLSATRPTVTDAQLERVHAALNLSCLLNEQLSRRGRVAVITKEGLQALSKAG